VHDLPNRIVGVPYRIHHIRTGRINSVVPGTALHWPSDECVVVAPRALGEANCAVAGGVRVIRARCCAAAAIYIFLNDSLQYAIRVCSVYC
jgi:hypothetical protein